MPPCHGGDRRFESGRARHKKRITFVVLFLCRHRPDRTANVRFGERGTEIKSSLLNFIEYRRKKCGISRAISGRGHLTFPDFATINNMNCPKCNKPMKKIAWRITNNGKEGEAYKEYEKNNYTCQADEVWIETEMPIEQ